MMQGEKRKKRDSQNGMKHNARTVFPIGEENQNCRHENVRQNFSELFRRAIFYPRLRIYFQLFTSDSFTLRVNRLPLFHSPLAFFARFFALAPTPLEPEVQNG